MKPKEQSFPINPQISIGNSIAATSRPMLPIPPALSVPPSRSWYSVSLPSISTLTAEIYPRRHIYMRMEPTGRKRPSSTFTSYETTPSPTSSVDMENYQVRRPGLRRIHSLESYRTPYAREMHTSSIGNISGKTANIPYVDVNPPYSQCTSVSGHSPIFQEDRIENLSLSYPLPLEPAEKNNSFGLAICKSDLQKGDGNVLQKHAKSTDFVDEKRKRNATASARFRLRRKEREREMAARISQLELDLKKVSEERDKWKAIAQARTSKVV